MSSGAKRLVINTQERAISSDINRLQSFAGAASGEFLRQLLNVQTNEEDPGISIASGSLGTPLGAEIANGLMVRPQVGTLDLIVDPGLLYAIAPDSDGDSSIYKLVKSAGLPAIGSLAMTANPAGSARIDVIECQVNPDVTVETDSRDIFDVTTGLFTAALVTKVNEDQLTFRVRAGVAGAGFPGAVAGWLPLVVASLPPATVNNDTITFWDVRPMLADRERQPMNATTLQRVSDLDYVWIRTAGPIFATSGRATASFAGRRVGGILRRGSPGVDANSLDFAAVANQQLAPLVEGVDTEAFLYLLFPFSLPRWARYTDAPGARLPRAPLGIPLLSSVVPDNTGAPSAAIAFPAVFGFAGATTILGTCFGMNRGDVQFSLMQVRDRIAHLNQGFAPTIFGANAVGTSTFTIPSSVYPAHAKAFWALVSGDFSMPAGSASKVQHQLAWDYDNVGANVQNLFGGIYNIANPTGGVVSHTASLSAMRVPLEAPRQGVTPVVTHALRWAHGVNPLGPAIAASASTCQIIGYEF
jgi:hypothetical protein